MNGANCINDCDKDSPYVEIDLSALIYDKEVTCGNGKYYTARRETSEDGKEYIVIEVRQGTE